MVTDGSPTEATDATLTKTIQGFLDELWKQTVSRRQVATIDFFRYNDLNVNLEQITLLTMEHVSGHFATDQGGCLCRNQRRSTSRRQAMESGILSGGRVRQVYPVTRG